MKKVSIIVILSIISPSIVKAAWEYSITDSGVRNHSYNASEITQDVYNNACHQDGLDHVFRIIKNNGEVAYYKWEIDESVMLGYGFSKTDTGKASIDFYKVSSTSGNTPLKRYYFTSAQAQAASDNTINTATSGYNTSSHYNINRDFIGGGNAKSSGAIYNAADITIDSINGNFVGLIVDRSLCYPPRTKDGGAISNSGNIGDIHGVFIKNSTVDSEMGHGGAIYNEGVIDNIVADFIGNTAELGGSAIYNSDTGVIGNITGDFIRNTISNKGDIRNVTGNFINTRSTGIYNGGSMGDIEGYFSSSPILNRAIINNISGGFSWSDIINYSVIGNITGNFYESYIRNDNANSVIDSVTGNFFGIRVFSIINKGTINNIYGSFDSASGYSDGDDYNYNNGNNYHYISNSGTINNLSGEFTGCAKPIHNSGTIGLSDVSFLTDYRAVENDGLMFVINGTENAPTQVYLQSMSGDGTFNLNEYTNVYVADGQSITQEYLNIAENSVLYVPTDGLNVTNVANSGLISLTTGVLQKNISSFGGNVEISGNVLSSADYIDTAITNNGTLNLTGGCLSDDNNVTGSGNIIINGEVSTNVNFTQDTTITETGLLSASVDNIKNINLTNNGQLVFIHTGTLDKALSNYGNVLNDGTLYTNANYIDQDIVNEYNLVLTGGTLSSNILMPDGYMPEYFEGNIVVDGDVVSNVNMTQDTTINSGKSLTVSVDNIKNTNLTNNGMLWFNGGTLDKALSNYGNVGNKGVLNANPVNIDQNFVNNGMLTVSSGTINHSINTDIVAGDFVAENSYGHMIIDGDVIANTLIAQDFITINDDKSLTISADNIRTDGFDNNGVLKLTGGTLDIFVPKYGYETQTVDIPYDYDFEADPYNIVTGVVNYNGEIVIDGDVISNEYIVQNTTINNGKSLTIFADGIKSDILTNNGLLKLSGGTLSENISNYGNTEIIGSIVANANNIDTTIVNHGVLNISGGVLRNDIIGGNTVINNGATIESIHVSDIEMNGVWNVGSNTVYASNANINGIVNMNIDGISKDSDLYIGGKLIADSITLGNDSELRLVVTANDLEQGESTGNIRLIESDLWDGNWQNVSQNNAKYNIDIDELNHTVKFTYTRTNEDIIIGGNEDPNSGNNETPENQGSENGGNSENPNSGNNENPGNTNTGNDEIPENQGSENGGNSENPNSGNNENPGNTNTGNNETPENQGSGNGGNSENPNSGNNENPGNTNTGNNGTPENQGSGNGGNSENPNSGNNENPENTNTGNNETPENQGSGNGGNSENPNSGNNENPGNTNTGNNETPENQGSGNGGNSERTNRVNNMINVANAWEQETTSNNPVVQQITNMLNYNSQYNVPEYLRMLRSIAPNDSAVIPGTNRMINTAIYNLVSNRLSAVGRSGGDVMTDVSVWGQGLQNHSSQSGDTGFTGNTSGFSLGADKKITEDAIIGLGYAYSDTSATAGDRNINADGHTLFVYAEYRNHKTSVDEEGNTISKTVSPLYFDAVLSYGMSNYEDKAGYGISSEYSTNTLGLNGNVGYYLTDNLDVFVGGRYLKISQDDYTDSIGQKISVKDDNVFTARFGGRYTGNGSVFIPTAHLELTYDVKSNDRLAVVNTENSSYQITGDAINPFGVQAGLGIISNIDNWKLSLNYDLEWHPEFVSHTGRIRAKYAF